jgi:23S rRNA pseudouridine2457 synthase
MTNLILFNKPFQVLSQFSPEGDKTTLKQYISVPEFYPAGRLDFDSEGLLALTNNGALQHDISNPQKKMEKTYWAQVEGDIDEQSLEMLRKGVILKDGITKPAKAVKIDPPTIDPRTPPIRERKNIPTSWVALSIKEGRNRQVRRMTAAVGFPTLRLIRYSIGSWNIDNIASGEYKSLTVDAPEANKKERAFKNNKRIPRDKVQKSRKFR